jgi:hypothetical protein
MVLVAILPVPLGSNPKAEEFIMAQLSGTWTITAVAKFAAWDQRIIISGSNNADGVYGMVVGSVIPNVQGIDMQIQTQAFNPGLGQWVDSFQLDRMSWDAVKGIVITIAADDRTDAPDLDFDDLIVECVSSDRELSVPPLNNPPLDLTIPEQYVKRRFKNLGKKQRKKLIKKFK